ncbi:TetR/AcrR family transcriptional regulator [Stappia sp. BW2]|uniref:TetR/AcrR family transcriptional regulator n=1 Tax=Stappia sp. BW2 TaxID=2592622 RepID=UPI0013967623|nr:TetR/AcrR family transcriptional regulator [Stappia sp. BW2]
MSSSGNTDVATETCPACQDDGAEQRQRGRQKVHDEATLKARVVEIAFSTFQKHSYNGTTMALVAKNTGISKRTLYELFPSKIELFAELAMRHRANLLDIPAGREAETLEEALKALFKVDQSDEKHLQQAAEMRLFYVEAVANEELGVLLRRACGSELHDVVTAWVEEEVAKGRIVTQSSRDTAKYLLDVLIAARLFRPRAPDVITGVSDIRTYLNHTIQLILNGLLPR